MRTPLVIAATLIATALVVPTVSCTALPQLTTGCGNKVLDDNEDCDGDYGDASPNKCIAPGQPSQCRWSCDGVACPTTFTCGIDKVCRRPSGAFITSAAIAGQSSKRVLLGDFDGDGAQDVVAVGPSTSRIHYFDGRTSTQQTLLSSEATLPALGQVTTDGRTSGIVTSTYLLNGKQQGNARVWRGSVDRTLLPTVYPNIDLTTQSVTKGRGISVVRAGQVGSDMFALFETTVGTTLLDVSGPTSATQPILVAGPLPPLDTIGNIHGRVAVGRLGTTACNKPASWPFTTCEAIVLAFDGSPTVDVYASCDGNLDVNAIKSSSYTAAIPFGLPNDVVGGPAFLVPSLSNGTGATLVVVGKKAVYAFPPNPADLDCSLSGSPTTVPIPVSPTTPLLALGYLSSPSSFDWVDAAGIHVGGSFVTPPPTNTIWTDAVIGDFNLNGLPDVVAASNGAIDFYNGTGGVLLNGKHITTDGTVTHMTVGDFDGDFVQDIAFSTQGDSTGLKTDAIGVAFGTFTGFPSQPVSVGRLENIQQLEPTFFDYRLNGTPDSINTIFAIGTADSTDNTAGDLVVSILGGNPDRLINSPFFLVDNAQQRSLVSTIVGNFGSTGKGIAGIAATTQNTATLWFTPMTGDAQVVVQDTSVMDALPASTNLDFDDQVPLDFDRPGLVAIDVGGDPGDELLVVQPKNFFLTSVGSWPALSYEALTNVGPVADKGIVTRVADVDDDGDADVIVEYMDTAAQKFAAKVIVNTKNGTLSFLGASPLQLPTGTIAVTTIHASNDGKTQLLALTGSGVLIAPYANGAAGTWSQVIDLTLAAFGANAHDVIAGDVDGDGVEDVVLATVTGFIVFFGEAS